MRPDFYGLKIDPAIPSEWKSYEVSKDFRGKHLSIKVNNPNGSQSGVKSLVLNGKELGDNYIPADMLLDENEIIVTL
jgi:cellobiose phosphorylase